MVKRIECKVTGRVQMVMFRDFVKRKAMSLNITGTVKNRDDGSVFVVAEAEEDALKELIKFLNKGSILAKVSDVKIEWFESKNEFSKFKIIY